MTKESTPCFDLLKLVDAGRLFSPLGWKKSSMPAANSKSYDGIQVTALVGSKNISVLNSRDEKPKGH